MKIKFNNAKDQAEYKQLCKLALEKKLKPYSKYRDYIRWYFEDRWGVKVSERQLRRLINGTK